MAAELDEHPMIRKHDGSDTLFATLLRDKGIGTHTINRVAEVFDLVCHECFDNYSDCRCSDPSPYIYGCSDPSPYIYGCSGPSPYIYGEGFLRKSGKSQIPDKSPIDTIQQIV